MYRALKEHKYFPLLAWKRVAHTSSYQDPPLHLWLNLKAMITFLHLQPFNKIHISSQDWSSFYHHQAYTHCCGSFKGYVSTGNLSKSFYHHQTYPVFGYFQER